MKDLYELACDLSKIQRTQEHNTEALSVSENILGKLFNSSQNNFIIYIYIIKIIIMSSSATTSTSISATAKASQFSDITYDIKNSSTHKQH